MTDNEIKRSRRKYCDRFLVAIFLTELDCKLAYFPDQTDFQLSKTCTVIRLSGISSEFQKGTIIRFAINTV